MNGMNEKTQESHEYKRQLRLIKRREQDEQGLSVKQMSNVNKGFSDVGKLTGNEGEMPTKFSVEAPNIEFTGCTFKTKVSIQFVSGASHSFD